MGPILRHGGRFIVDSNLKFDAYDNLYACDLSVFPASPAANRPWRRLP